MRLKQLYAIALILCMSICVSSCSEETGDGSETGGGINNKKSMLMGEWKATEIEATFLNGNVVTITNPENIEDELGEMAWIDVMENYIRQMKYRHVILVPYEIINNYLIFEGAESGANYEIESVTKNELIIKYTGEWTSYITYKKVAKEPIDKKMLIGEWKATLISSYYNEITDEDKIKKQLQGLEWVALNENILTMMGSGVSFSYSVKNNYLEVASANLQLLFAIDSVTENKIVVNSTNAFITYTRVQKKDYKISGKVEKGPFINGSSVSLEMLDSKLNGSGKVYNSETTDNLGSFSFDCKEVSDAYAEIKANGYFFNELQNTLSNGTFTLKALVDLNNASNVNINILTHIKSARVKTLVSYGMSFSEANEQAQKEILDIFALNNVIKKDVETISIADGSEEAAALLAVSSLILMNRTEAELTEYMATINSFFGEYGYLPTEVQEKMEKDKNELAKYISEIRSNIISRYESQGKSISVKDLSYYIDWDNDGIVGNEILKEGEKTEVLPAVIDVPYEGGSYSVQITSPIPVYLEPQVATNSNTSSGEVIITTPVINTRASDDAQINCECEIYGQTLYINVFELESNTNKTKTISLYDYIGNVVATVEIRQEALSIIPQRIDFTVKSNGNGTRAINTGYTDFSKIAGFKVYGTKYENGNKENLFDGAEIINNQNNKWEYKYEDDTKYWRPSAEYSFAAVVNATSVTTDSGTPEVIHFTSDGETDLLYASENFVRTDEYAHPTAGVNNNMQVPFEFNHLLSKLEFEFTNETNLYCKVSNIKIGNAYAKGEYNVSTKEWKYIGAETIDIDFGNATNSKSENAAAEYIKNEEIVTSNYARFLIPGGQDITFTYDYEMYDGENVYKSNKSYNIMMPLKAGYSHKIRIGLQGKEDDYMIISITEGDSNNEVITRH